MRKTIALILLVMVMSGCTQASKVSHNVSKEADNFNVLRRLAVINTMTGEPLFEMIGRLSIEVDAEQNKLSVIVEVEEGVYKKHIIGLNDATTMFVVEDIGGAVVNQYKYEVNYMPESIIPFTITNSD
ncbi:MAG: hypothetical protein IJP92_00720 [Lachnospiraceae bacterium]|nr:hypothetical protein [Lachnospiraceae bacterium]